MIESLLCTTGLAIRHGTGGLTVLPTLCKELEHLHVLVSTRGLEPIPHGYLYFLSFLCLKMHHLIFLEQINLPSYDLQSLILKIKNTSSPDQLKFEENRTPKMTGKAVWH